MATAPSNLSQLNKAVVAFLDGRRLKGYLYNFSALKTFFDLLPQENPLLERGTRIDFGEVKAIFFVRDFVGNAGRQRVTAVDPKKHGRKIQVACKDGEILVGMTEGFNPQKPGFFLFPISEQDNNLRAFVINKNVTSVKFV